MKLNNLMRVVDIAQLGTKGELLRYVALPPRFVHFVPLLSQLGDFLLERDQLEAN